jgi:hypothetical protein
LPAGVGFLMGRRTSHLEINSEQPVSTKVGATLILLAFALTLTFSMASSRHDLRRQLEIDEANAIGITYRRANLLPAPYNQQAQTLLREYVDIRLEVAGDPVLLSDAMVESEQLQNRMWKIAEALAKRNARTWTAAWYIESLTNITKLNTQRMTAGLHSRVPLAVWGGLGLIAVLTMLAVGYQAGLSNTLRAFPTAMLVLSFVVIITLIVDLDRPQGGLIRVGQSALEDVQKTMLPSIDPAPKSAIEESEPLDAQSR